MRVCFKEVDQHYELKTLFLVCCQEMMELLLKKMGVAFF